ncbi:MAG: leucine-rich repeat domain-containing protein [Ruminococcaceae bacterium]|nr:leucine-rich repeat domain-containing protein [Oscillospiraceae bacterium]
MKRKIFLTILMIALCMCLFAICASAAVKIGDETNGYVYYDLSKNNTFEGYTGTATVSTANRTSEDTDKSTHIVIPEVVEYDSNGDGTPDERYVVTAVAQYAFGHKDFIPDNVPLVSITIPRTISSIGTHAFRQCPSLETVICNAQAYNPVTGTTGNVTLYDAEFYKCPNLKSVDMSNSTIVKFTKYTFTNCTSLETVILPEGLTVIGEHTFEDCSSLTNINFPRSIHTVGNSAFWDATNVSGDLVFDTFISLSPHAFRETNITSFVVLNGVLKGENGAADKVFTSLNTDAAFYNCSQLEYMVLPDTVTTSGANTFTNCNKLKYIVCSDNYTNIVSSIPANASLIVRGTNYEAMSAWGWEAVPFSQYDPTSSAKNKIYYGAIATDDPTVLADFTGFDNSFGTWDATTNEKTSYDAVVEVLGYSTKNNSTGIATGFKVNQASVDAYKSIFGGDIKLGIVIFNPSFIGDTFFDAEGKINAEKGAIQVELVENYSTLSASVAGFDLSNEAHQKLELVFAGYAYTKADKSDIDLFQKEYVGTQENPVSSPMQSKVVKGDDVLYTVKLQTVTTPVNITTGKDGLNAFGA